MTKKEKEKLEAIKHLKQFIKKGDTIFTKIEKVSTSGMYRHIKVIGIENNSPLFLSWHIATALDYPYKEKTSDIKPSFKKHISTQHIIKKQYYL